MESRGWDGEELARREAHQLSTDEKRRRADVVLVNDGSVAQLRERVLSWIQGSGGLAGLARRSVRPRLTEERDERDDESGRRLGP
jgi:hypothetical protein